MIPFKHCLFFYLLLWMIQGMALADVSPWAPLPARTVEEAPAPQSAQPQSAQAYADGVALRRRICAMVMETLLEALKPKDKKEDIRRYLDEYAKIPENKDTKDFSKQLQDWLVRADAYISRSEVGFLRELRGLEIKWVDTHLASSQKWDALFRLPNIADRLKYDEKLAVIFLKSVGDLSERDMREIQNFYKRLSVIPEAKDFYAVQRKMIGILTAYRQFMEQHAQLETYRDALRGLRDYARLSFEAFAPEGFELTALELGLRSFPDGTSVLPSTRLKKTRVKKLDGVEVHHAAFKYSPYYKRAFRSFDGTLVIKYVYDTQSQREVASIYRYTETKPSWWARFKAALKKLSRIWN